MTPELVPHLVRQAAVAYGAIGAVVAAAFLLLGLDRVDPAARGAYAFPPLLVPGLVLLWPVVALRWRALERGRGWTRAAAMQTRHRSVHVRMWIGLAIASPVLLLAALALRQEGPLEAAPVRLDEQAAAARAAP